MKKELDVIPVPDARLIPRYLLEQVKDRKWSVDEWYKHQKELAGVSSNIVLSVIDRQHRIKGLVWLTVDNFQKNVYINTLSIDPEYQRKSKLIKFLSKYIRDIAKAVQVDTVVWAARRHRALERYGFNESEYKIYEGKV